VELPVAGRVMIAWFAYKAGEWHGSECNSLSIATSAPAKRYTGDPVDLPDGGAMLLVVEIGALFLLGVTGAFISSQVR